MSNNRSNETIAAEAITQYWLDEEKRDDTDPFIAKSSEKHDKEMGAAVIEALTAAGRLARATPTREQIAELHLEHWVFDAEYRGTDHGLEIWVSVCDCDWESSVWSTQEAAKREHGEHFADALALLIAGLAEGERQ